MSLILLILQWILFQFIFPVIKEVLVTLFADKIQELLKK